MVSIALVDARKTSLTGVQNSAHKKSAQTMLRGSWTMVSIALVTMLGKHHLRGFKIAKKSARRYRGSWTMVSIALVDAQENITYGMVQYT